MKSFFHMDHMLYEFHASYLHGMDLWCMG